MTCRFVSCHLTHSHVCLSLLFVEMNRRLLSWAIRNLMRFWFVTKQCRAAPSLEPFKMPAPVSCMLRVAPSYVLFKIPASVSVFQAVPSRVSLKMPAFVSFIFRTAPSHFSFKMPALISCAFWVASSCGIQDPSAGKLCVSSSAFLCAIQDVNLEHCNLNPLYSLMLINWLYVSLYVEFRSLKLSSGCYLTFRRVCECHRDAGDGDIID